MQTGTSHHPAAQLSLVTVLRREQAYVEDFGRSALRDRGAAIELVAVDDGADMHGPPLLDELAAADARVRVVHLPERVSEGEARAEGLRLARAPHVWFVRPTDVLAPGAAATVLGRLAATDADVLLLDGERQGHLGAVRPGPHRELLRRLAG